ncbi:hypothetical protein L873DRAFT_1792998 [Choiromyces venosus 120613-1]|uniref:EGF-like domain-containing protein n=1 Tax=Choiromyces venosus 120613-1 TaxID=1336337 RepID=A0A3N4JD09_9PEZI|nr:hypothetical protein L873DRAFT_1792998 [Choiromyces venosus 120613-1]
MGGASRNGDYRYKRQEEDEDTDYQYFPIGTGYGAGEALTNLNNRLSSQIAQPPPRKPQLLKSPMSSRQDGGNNGRPQKIPQVLRVPSNNGNGNSNGNRGPPSRPARSNYVPSMLDPSDVQEQVLNPRFSYRPNQPPIRPQPRAPRLSEEDVGNPASPTNRPSMSSSRSIYIGFDPTNSQATTPSAASTLGVIPNSPSVPPPIPTVPNQQRRSSNGPPPTARRGTSSYHSQQTLMVSPIPEEPFSDRHDSYASSTAIPSSWGAGPAEFDPRGEEESFGDGEVEEFRLPTGGDAEDDERGLVRQASLGRKSKPTITEIKSIDRIKSPDREFGSKSSNESMKTASSGAGAFGGIGIGFSSPAEKNSPTLKLPSVGSPTSVPGLALGQSPVSSRSASSSPLAQPPIAFTREDYDESSGFPFPNSLGHSKGISSDSLDSGGLTATGKFPTGTTKPGRRLPPRLNMDAVRDAEARGSLTSLPDLIRRATKLAAVLETGRPDSRWVRSNGRETDSISDILASFPPPVLASSRQGRRATAMSQWPLPGDFNNENNSSIRPSREQGRRICGLPLWAFILLVILALLVISAAVIVPLQLVKLSKGDKDGGNDSGKSVLAECRSKNPCQNGGENIATSTFCGCVCTSGFTGANCTQKEDSSCTTVDLQDLQGGRVKGIQNVTMGTALPRLFNLAEPSYNIKLDRAMILAVFSKEDISCTAQNALVRFNGESMPSTNGKRSTIDETPSLLQRRQDLTVDRSPTPTVGGATPSVTSSSSASSATKTAAVDSDAVDFARVTVLYLTNARNLSVAEDAQYRLQVAFSGGIDFGDLAVGSNITVDFNNRSIRMADGDIIGGITANSTGNSGGNRTSNSGSKKRSVLEDYFRTLFV